MSMLILTMVFSSENIAEAQKSDSYKNAALENIATRTSVRQQEIQILNYFQCDL